MKKNNHLIAGVALFGAMACPAALAGTNHAGATNKPVELPKSIFTQPASPSEGRDPFFPESTRPFAGAQQSTQSVRVVEPTTLAIRGYSIVNGHPAVIINNHSFMAGDEGDVRSSNGTSHIRCLEIDQDSVIVEVNGARRRIPF